MPRSDVKGLYFPYASVRSADALKTAILYFDKIAVIHPDAAFCASGQADLGHFGVDPGFRNEALPLVREGVLELVDPASVIAEHGQDIMLGVIQDLSDPSFLRLCEPYVNTPWTLSSRKLPTDADRWLRNILVNVPGLSLSPDAPRTASGARARRYIEIREEPIERHERLERPHVRECVALPRYYEERRGRYAHAEAERLSRERGYDEDRMVQLPFAAGEAVMMGHAMAVAGGSGMTPFCDEQIHLDFLRLRYSRAASADVTKMLLAEYGYIRDAKCDLMAQEVIRATVPSLADVPVDALLEFRNRRADQLEGFRTYMRSLVNEVEGTPWDEAFAAHVNELVDSKITPALKGIEDEIKAYRDEFWVDALTTTAQVSPLPIIGSVFVGIPHGLAVALGGTLAGLSLMLRSVAKMRKIRRNGLALLLGAREMTKRAKARTKRR